MRRPLLVVLVAALAAAAPAAAALPHFPSGTSVGEGVPLKAYTSVTPAVHLFGDVVTARLAVVADTKFVDPARLQVSTGFKPYKLVELPRIQRIDVGRFAQVTWTWTLRCLTQQCVPEVPPSDRYHIFRFQTIHISYLTTRGRPAYEIDATFPKIEVLSQVTPGVADFLLKTNHLNWRFELAPVAAPSYRMSPGLLYRLAIGVASAFFLAAGFFAWRWYRVIHPPALAEGRTPVGTPLERALNLLAWAHARGDETLERKALERIAGELGIEAPVADVDELSRAARELAWSSLAPEDEAVETLTERARETGLSSKAEEPSE